MWNIELINEVPTVIDFLKKRNLIPVYKKIKQKILSGCLSGVDLKFRKPKGSGILSFRINKQYRALCEKDGNVLFVFKIDDHQ